MFANPKWIFLIFNLGVLNMFSIFVTLHDDSWNILVNADSVEKLKNPFRKIRTSISGMLIFRLLKHQFITYN